MGSIGQAKDTAAMAQSRAGQTLDRTPRKIRRQHRFSRRGQLRFLSRARVGAKEHEAKQSKTESCRE